MMIGGKKIEEYMAISSSEFTDNMESLDHLPVTDETSYDGFLNLIEDSVFNGINDIIIFHSIK